MKKNLKTARPIVALKKGRNDWFQFKNVSDGLTELFIYDEIGYWGVTADDLVNELKNQTAETLTVRINSPGGNVFDGIAILNALRQYPGKVITQVDGLAASAASFIFQAGTERVVMNNSEVMIHNASGLTIGDAKDMREMADMLDRATANIASIYAERSGTSVDQWIEAMGAETWYSADEAVAAGLADSVGGRKADDSEASNAFDLSIFSYSSRADAPDPTIVPIKATQPIGETEDDDFVFNPETFRKAMEELNNA
jgi:ATP-dependent Clp endopeptidase proteolytic subunit ClpP